MLDDAKMDELLARLEPFVGDGSGPGRTFRYFDVLEAVSSEYDVHGEQAYAAIREWLARRGGDVEGEVGGPDTPLLLFPDPPEE